MILPTFGVWVGFIAHARLPVKAPLLSVLLNTQHTCIELALWDNDAYSLLSCKGPTHKPVDRGLQLGCGQGSLFKLMLFTIDISIVATYTLASCIATQLRHYSPV